MGAETKVWKGWSWYNKSYCFYHICRIKLIKLINISWSAVPCFVYFEMFGEIHIQVNENSNNILTLTHLFLVLWLMRIYNEPRLSCQYFRFWWILVNDSSKAISHRLHTYLHQYTQTYTKRVERVVPLSFCPKWNMWSF